MRTPPRLNPSQMVQKLLAAKDASLSQAAPGLGEPPPRDDRENVRAIILGLAAESKAFRSRHPWVHRFQNPIGLAILLAGVAVVMGNALAYQSGFLPMWTAIVLAALAGSIVHEIEHDLIHSLYYRNVPVIRHLMMLLCWLARPTQVNPWVRQNLHLEHHRVSGTALDVEERAISNGEPWSLARLLMLPDTTFAGLLQNPLWRNPKVSIPLVLLNVLGHFPVTWVAHASLVLAIAAKLVGMEGLPSTLAPWVPMANLLAVVWVVPDLLRTFCLTFISSNVHYYGDVRVGELLRQTQVLNRWYFLPFQVFCFNFGGTHAIHHFRFMEPFYLRQVTASRTLPILRANGVRFNDVGTFWRANRYDTIPEHAPLQVASA